MFQKDLGAALQQPPTGAAGAKDAAASSAGNRGLLMADANNDNSALNLQTNTTNAKDKSKDSFRLFVCVCVCSGTRHTGRPRQVSRCMRVCFSFRSSIFIASPPPPS